MQIKALKIRSVEYYGVNWILFFFGGSVVPNSDRVLSLNTNNEDSIPRIYLKGIFLNILVVFVLAKYGPF